MKSNHSEQIILYVLMTCISLVLASLVRITALSFGSDSFTAFILFIITLAILLIIYLSIRVFMQDLMFPLISKGLNRISFIRKKIAKAPSPTTKGEYIHIEDSTCPPLDVMRKEQQQNKNAQKEESIKLGLDYTQKTFALYLSDSDLEILSQNVHIYIAKLDLDSIKAVRVKELTALDIRHFGWNIWNRFRSYNQMETARFLKIVFPDIFYDTEIDSIKSHLKDDELKGIIKIENNI